MPPHIAAAQPAESSSQPQQTKAEEFLAFTLGAEEYGINIMKVQEIRNYEKVTAIANAPAHIRGVMNLRGMIVPVIDMRLLLKVGEAKFDPFTVVVVANINSKVIGMIVDSVSDVTTLPADAIRPPPDLGTTGHTSGIGTLDGRMIILLDIDALMRSEELKSLDHNPS
jgi:purine-binding chemotaxis protein CheW